MQTSTMANARNESILKKYKRVCAKAKNFFSKAKPASDNQEEKKPEPKATPTAVISAASISESVDKTRRLLLEKTASKSAERNDIVKLAQNAKADVSEDEDFIYIKRQSKKTDCSSNDSGFEDCELVKKTPTENAKTALKNDECVNNNIKDCKVAEKTNIIHTKEVKEDNNKNKSNLERESTNESNRINIAKAGKTFEKYSTQKAGTSDETKIGNENKTDKSVLKDSDCVKQSNIQCRNAALKTPDEEKIQNQPALNLEDETELCGQMLDLAIRPDLKVVADLNKLTLSEREDVKKKKKVVYLQRGPTKGKNFNHYFQPYPDQRIVNAKLYTGGHMIVNCEGRGEQAPYESGSTSRDERTSLDDGYAVEDCIKEMYQLLPETTINSILDQCSVACQNILPSNPTYQFDINVDAPTHDIETTQQTIEVPANLLTPPPRINNFQLPPTEATANYQFDTETASTARQYGLTDAPAISQLELSEIPATINCQFGLTDGHRTVLGLPECESYQNTKVLNNILTPPRSNDSHVSSPPHSVLAYADNPSLSDDDVPVTLPAVAPETKKKKTTHMNVFKKRMQALEADFKGMACCREGVEGVKLLSEQFYKCSPQQRKALVLQVNKITIEQLFNLLYFRVLAALEDDAPDAGSDVNLSVLLLAGQRLLAERPGLLLDQGYGLALLSRAAMRCSRRPCVAVYLAQCVRRAALADPARDRQRPVFTQTDEHGCTLAGAVARLGDSHALCLSALVARDPIPLFHIDAVDSEGYTALHAACRLHDVRGPSMLRVIHTLIAHGGAQLTTKDNKSGDTAFHLAVDASGCDVDLVLTLAVHAPRPIKRFIHSPNNSNCTPIKMARAAAKTRPGYPEEVVHFLEKCRL